MNFNHTSGHHTSHKHTSGYALVVALSLLAVLVIVVTTYTILTVNNSRTSASSANGSAGFYAAEAVLNSRAERVRQKFKGFEVPNGTSPATTTPCLGTNVGTADFACESVTISGRAVTSYVTAKPTVPIQISAGEDFEYLSAQETPFTVYGQAVGRNGNPEAITSLTFRSRLVPLFQFAIFFDKDLEFQRTATLDLSGPVHTNGNLFMDVGGNATLTIRGQTTSARNIYRGQKFDGLCNAGSAQVADATNTLQTLACGGMRTQITTAQMEPFGGRLKILPRLTVPSIDVLQPTPDALYWREADVRVVLKRRSGTGDSPSATWLPYFVGTTGAPISGVGTCPALTTSQTLRDNREAQYWTAQTTPGNTATGPSTANNNRASRRTLNVDVRGLLACLHDNRVALGLGSTGISETTEGGLVLYFTLDDSSSTGILANVLAGMTPDGISQGAGPNNYAVRLRNGALLRSSNATHPAPRGVTFVTDQAAIIEGDFNTPATRANGWLPSSVLSDSINVLSNDWAQTRQCLYRSGSTNFYMARAEYRLVGGTPRRRSDVSEAQWTAGTPITSGTLSAMGQTWHAYTAANSGATLAESFTGDAKSTVPLWCRNASATTVRTAILAGTATSGEENRLYPDDGPVPVASGGVNNMMRYHEEWGANGYHPVGQIDHTYRGSLVSLSQPLHARGAFVLGEGTFYNPPRRIWSFEEQFRDAANLPPLTPRFVYLKQDNFTRNFEQP